MMRKFILFIGLCFMLDAGAQNNRYSGTGSASEPASATDGKALPKTDNRAFQKGEMLEWRVHYGFIEAGTARIEVKDTEKKIGNRNVYHVVGEGKSRGAFDWFFRVRDRYESFIDEEGIYPWLFVRRVDEGGFIINQDYTFLQHKNMVDNGEGERFEVPPGIQDMVSAFYYSRTMDLSNAAEGDIFTVETFVDDEVYLMEIKYKGLDTVKIGLGEFSCLKFSPIVQKGRVFKKEEDLMVWITNDENKIPVLARARILVGSVKMELQDYSGLANPVAKIE